MKAKLRRSKETGSSVLFDMKYYRKVLALDQRRRSLNLPNKRPRLIKIGLSSLTLGTSSVSTVWYNCRLDCLENDEENDGGSGGRFRRLRVSDDERRGTVSKCLDTSIDDNACPPLICNRMLLCWTTSCTMSPHWSCNIRTSSYVESIRELPLNSRIWSPTSIFPCTSAGPPRRIFVTKQPANQREKFSPFTLKMNRRT